MRLNAIAVFIVEDEPLIKEILQIALEDSGFEVNTACNGMQAIARLEAQPTKFQALITDVNLSRSKLTGWDVARRARELKPDLPVVYMTGDCAHEWASIGVPDSVLLMKPFTPSQLLKAVSQLLHGSNPDAPSR